MKGKFFLFLIASLLLPLIIGSCKSNSEEIFLLKSLDFAGENKLELENVLKHFEDDSLKFEAAKFLIRNMPFHNYHECDYKLLNSYYDELYELMYIGGMHVASARDSLVNKHQTILNSRFNIKNDAQNITAEFIINNIEHAFMAWENAPWKKDVDFSLFCREILPYRIGNEGFENWRPKYYDRFKPIIDSLSITDPLTAIQAIYDSIIKEKWSFVNDTNLPHRGALFLLDKRMGSCTEYSILMTNIMRSLAIPGGTDMILQNPAHADKAHYWNYVTDKFNNKIDFTLYEKRPTPSVIGPPNRLKGKVYRKNFEIQKESLRFLYPEEKIPSSLSSLLLSDVSNEYIDGVDLLFDVENNMSDGDLVYISVFNNNSWVPIDWTKVNTGKAKFINLDPGIVYLLTTHKNNTDVQIDFPVLITKDKKIVTLIPDFEKEHQVIITRKYPLKHFHYVNMSIDGKFQASNDISFKNAFDLHTITKENRSPYDTIYIETENKYKFMRYYSPKGGYCNMAEIKFFSDDNKELTGSIIGTSGSLHNNKLRTKFSVFDNDPLTFYEGKDYYENWVGIALEQPQKIKKIEYAFRNDDNYIRPNDEYELFFFSKEGVKSLGSKIGTDIKELRFDNVPKNSLLWLRNNSRGVEERIFTYENDTQVWW